jgi:hypothetical protein
VCQQLQLTDKNPAGCVRNQATLYTTNCLSSPTLASLLPSLLNAQLQTWSVCSLMVCTRLRLDSSQSFTCREQQQQQQKQQMQLSNRLA